MLCQIKVSADQYYVTISRAQVFKFIIKVTCFLKLTAVYCQFSHDVTKILTTKLLILLIFYLNEV